MHDRTCVRACASCMRSAHPSRVVVRVNNKYSPETMISRHRSDPRIAVSACTSVYKVSVASGGDDRLHMGSISCCWPPRWVERREQCQPNTPTTAQRALVLNSEG